MSVYIQCTFTHWFVHVPRGPCTFRLPPLRPAMSCAPAAHRPLPIGRPLAADRSQSASLPASDRPPATSQPSSATSPAPPRPATGNCILKWGHVKKDIAPKHMHA